MTEKELANNIKKISIGLIIFFVVLLLVWPYYNVWASGMSGKAKLQEAEFGRQTRVAEAQAKLDSSKLEAQAEIARAKGQALANRELTSTLSPEVLQYQYIRMLEERGSGGQETVIYIPTDSRTGLPVSLPLPESQRLVKKSN